MKKEIVSNASSLIFMGKLNIFYLVKNLYTSILVPKEVLHEIFRYDKPENHLIEHELDSGFLKEVAVKKINEFPIHIGEKAAISLCLEKNISIFLSEDKKARKYARSLRIKTLGVLGILLMNLKLKHINKQEAKDLIQKLIEKGHYMTSELYARLLDLID